MSAGKRGASAPIPPSWELVGMGVCVLVPLVVLFALPRASPVQLTVLRLMSAIGLSSFVAYVAPRVLPLRNANLILAARLVLFAITFVALDRWLVPRLHATVHASASIRGA